MAKNINIEGEIYGYNWGALVSDLTDVKDATIYVNSGGGSVTEGFALHDAIKRVSENANIEIIGTGIVASIATIVLLAAKKGNRKMTENSFFMIHNPTIWMDGDAEKLRNSAIILEAMRERLVNVYTNAIESNSKLINSDKDDTRAQIIKWMDSETWFTAQQALEVGFIDAIVIAKDYDVSAAKNSLKQFNNVPKEILNKMSDITEAEKTMFQRFINFLGFKNDSTTTNMALTNEQMIELLQKAGYIVEMAKEEEEEMTEEQMLDSLSAAGVNMKKKEAESMVEPEKEEAATAKLTAQILALKEENTRIKLANTRPRISDNTVATEGKTRSQIAMEKVISENKDSIDAMVTSIKNKI